MVSKEGPNPESLRSMIDVHRSNEEFYHERKEAFMAELYGEWVAVCNKGEIIVLADSRDELLEKLHNQGLTTGSEFVTYITP